MGPQGGVPLALLQRFRATIDWWDPEFLDFLAAGHAFLFQHAKAFTRQVADFLAA